MVDILIARFAQRSMYVVFGLAALMFYFCGVVAVGSGMWALLFPAMWLVSPIMMALLRVGLEGPLKWSFINPRVMSWCFVVGDGILLPFALWFAGRGWQQLSLTNVELFGSMVSAVFIGLMVMIGFRKVDGDRYRTAGWESSLYSPTKVWHDCVVMPVVVAMLMFLLAPQLVTWINGSQPMRGGDMFISLIMVSGFIALVAVDGVNQPDPRAQHHLWNQYRFESAGIM